MSVVPPPISTIIFPTGCSMSIPIPMAAAIGSWIMYTSLALACSAESRTARFSTSVIAEGIQITIRKEGGKSLRPVSIIFIIPRIIISAAWKSAITPSLSGRIVLMLSWVFSCICMASRPMANTLLVVLSIAIMLGSSTTTLSLQIISVFAVPKSMAISVVKKSKSPIRFSPPLVKFNEGQNYRNIPVNFKFVS